MSEPSGLDIKVMDASEEHAMWLELLPDLIQYLKDKSPKYKRLRRRMQANYNKKTGQFRHQHITLDAYNDDFADDYMSVRSIYNQAIEFLDNA